MTEPANPSEPVEQPAVDEGADEAAREQPGSDPSTEPSPDAKRALLDELLAGSSHKSASSRAPAGVATGPRTRVGRLVEWSSGEAPRVEFEGNERGPLAARSTIALDPTIIVEAIQSERGVLLTFEDGRPDAPIITGLLQSFGDPVREIAPPQPWDDEQGGEQAGEQAEAEQPSNIAEVEARVDGRRVELEAADEIVLRCGKASIVLRRNGRVVIRGTYVETRSRGVNRVKGGSVEIN